MIEIDFALYPVVFKPGHAAVCQFTREQKDRTQQTSLQLGNRARLNIFIRGYAAAAVYGPTCVGLLFRPAGFRLLPIQAGRAAVSVVVIKPAIRIIALNQTSRGRVILRGGERQSRTIIELDYSLY